MKRLIYYALMALSILPPTKFFLFRGFALRIFGVDVGSGAQVTGGIRLYGDGNLVIGKRSWVGLRFTTYFGIGSRVVIGDDCDIAPDVVIHTGSHIIGDASRRAGPGIALDVVIGDGCWIGTRSTILGGANIGQGCIVAAGAIVLPGEYPQNVILAGVPAVIKKNIIV